MPAPVVVVIGVFDGVHLGHRALIEQARSEADSRGLDLVAVTFDPHPADVVRPGSGPAALTSIGYRTELLRAAGADRVHVLSFDTAMSQMSPDEFVERVLRDELHAGAAVVGENFRFGRAAAGSAADIARHGIDVVEVELAGRPLTGGEAVSSTRIRALIAAGDVAAAARLLGRPHRVEGTVVHGEHRGRELGFPTANLGDVGSLAIPADGVYAAVLSLEHDRAARWPAAVSVGTNPTFGELDRRIEAYAIDAGHDLDLYGRRVAVDFLDRLRGMEAFDSVAALIDQMDADVDRARVLVAEHGPL